MALHVAHLDHGPHRLRRADRPPRRLATSTSPSTATATHSESRVGSRRRAVHEGDQAQDRRARPAGPRLAPRRSRRRSRRPSRGRPLRRRARVSRSASETNGTPPASSTSAVGVDPSGTSGLSAMPVRNEAVSAEISTAPASAVPIEAPRLVTVFCRPPTSPVCSSGTAETVTAPSCDARHRRRDRRAAAAT